MELNEHNKQEYPPMHIDAFNVFKLIFLNTLYF